VLEPTGLTRRDGKRPDGGTLVPWKCRRPLTWDFTCADTFAPISSFQQTSNSAGGAADKAESLKTQKYGDIMKTHIFAPIGVETMGAWGREVSSFIKDLSVPLRNHTKEPRANNFLLQRLSMAIQRGNSTSVMGTVPHGKLSNAIYYVS
jgi:hypothetical protein